MSIPDVVSQLLHPSRGTLSYSRHILVADLISWYRQTVERWPKSTPLFSGKKLKFSLLFSCYLFVALALLLINKQE